MAGDDRPTRGDPVVHPSAVLGDDVELDDGVEIGPFCFLDGRVRIGAGTRLLSHITILGDTEIGRDNVLHPNVVIGDEPQDISYTGGPRAVRIGDRNIFREGVTIHRGSETGEVTIVGDDNYFMQNSHAAHDCRIGNSTIIAGGALLAGWVEVGDRAMISGNCVVHQFVRIGRLSLMRGLSRTSRDIPPFCIADGTHTVHGINTRGLQRAGWDSAQIREVRKAFRALFTGRRNLKAAVEDLLGQGPLIPEVAELIEFINASRRGVAFGPRDQHTTPGE
ncbi:MAG TPA: acyl-ACP--UDP-N-acetylglucosamine O-acyltransferase [Candidatus Binataceae bacterium]|jgi:UDP-N-acetylglucosamine acyltransferase|nr:acyl-ACP--UDP-N-acetylglucosamine O-acyltransferase [Candidatus Binataceae bacterium]